MFQAPGAQPQPPQGGQGMPPAGPPMGGGGPPAGMQPAPPPAPLPVPQGPPPVTIDAVMALFKDTALRKFRIDIEADSTVTGDESQDRADRAQFIESLTKLVEAWGPLCEAQPALTNLAGELMMFGARGFRIGNSLEETIESTVEKLSASLGQPKPPPQPSPDELVKAHVAQNKGETEIQRANISVEQARVEAEGKAQEAQLAATADQRAHEMTLQEHALKMQAMTMDQERANLEHAHKIELLQAQHASAMAAATHRPKAGE